MNASAAYQHISASSVGRRYHIVAINFKHNYKSINLKKPPQKLKSLSSVWDWLTSASQTIISIFVLYCITCHYLK